jgi:hypothetical protein
MRALYASMNRGQGIFSSKPKVYPEIPRKVDVRAQEHRPVAPSSTISSDLSRNVFEERPQHAGQFYVRPREILVRQPDGSMKNIGEEYPTYHGIKQLEDYQTLTDAARIEQEGRRPRRQYPEYVVPPIDRRERIPESPSYNYNWRQFKAQNAGQFGVSTMDMSDKRTNQAKLDRIQLRFNQLQALSLNPLLALPKNYDEYKMAIAGSKERAVGLGKKPSRVCTHCGLHK